MNQPWIPICEMDLGSRLDCCAAPKLGQPWIQCVRMDLGSRLDCCAAPNLGQSWIQCVRWILDPSSIAVPCQTWVSSECDIQDYVRIASTGRTLCQDANVVWVKFIVFEVSSCIQLASLTGSHLPCEAGLVL